MRTLLIYSAMCNELKNVIDSTIDYVINNGFLDYSKDYCISTYISDIKPTRTRLSGEAYEGHTATIQFIFQAGSDADSVITARSMIQDVEDYLAELQNKYITTTKEFEILDTGKVHRVKSESERQIAEANGVNLFVSRTKLITSTIQMGKNEVGKQMFSLNAAIAYYITGNNIVTTQAEDEVEADTTESDANN